MARTGLIGRGRLVLFFACLGLLTKSGVAAATASDLQTYVQQCQTELGFQASDVTALNLNCNNGVNFVHLGAFINDYLIYKRINDSVDLTVACRWVDQNFPTATTAASIEMIIHNRKIGSTCFFAADNSNNPTGNVRPLPVAIVSPTNFPAADGFWLQPRTLNTAFLPIYVDDLSPDQTGNTNALRCVGCHSQGPYIASIRIAPTLARFGLLNDRHDTQVDMMKSNHYHATGSGPYNNQDPTKPFGGWDAIIYEHADLDKCSSGCHAFDQSDSPTDSLSFLDTATMLLPSITRDRNEILQANPPPMPPYDLSSDYRWINLDTPGDGVETESYVDSLAASGTLVPALLKGGCAQPQIPTNLAAHAVGVDGVNSISGVILQGGQFQSTDTGDYFRQFSLKDGLVCMNADQDPGRTCHDYDVSYLCKNDTWTPFYNSTVSKGGDDHEERSRVSAQVLAACGGVAPIAMQARTKLVYTSGTYSVTLTGPGDRLARFSPYGLTCNNADQPDGKCSNYVVRYEGCNNPDQNVPRVVQSTWSGKILTATSSANNTAVKGQTSNGTNAQKWVVELVANTEYVRLRNLSTNTYLNLTSQAEAATVVSSTSSTSTSQRWTTELVFATNQYRLRNLWSGRYLTISGTSNGAGLLSQAKNASWTSQRWTLQ